MWPSFPNRLNKNIYININVANLLARLKPGLMKRVATAAATHVKRAGPASVDDGGGDKLHVLWYSYLQRLTYIRPLPAGVSEPFGSKVSTTHSSTPQLPRDPT